MPASIDRRDNPLRTRAGEARLQAQTPLPSVPNAAGISAAGGQSACHQVRCSRQRPQEGAGPVQRSTTGRAARLWTARGRALAMAGRTQQQTRRTVGRGHSEHRAVLLSQQSGSRPATAHSSQQSLVAPCCCASRQNRPAAARAVAPPMATGRREQAGIQRRCQTRPVQHRQRRRRGAGPSSGWGSPLPVSLCSPQRRAPLPRCGSSNRQRVGLATNSSQTQSPQRVSSARAAASNTPLAAGVASGLALTGMRGMACVLATLGTAQWRRCPFWAARDSSAAHEGLTSALFPCR
jgi:hypothetical protein